jgi:CysZ protein
MKRRRSKGFFAGLAYPIRGARLVYLEQRRLARFWLPPIGLTAAAFGLVFWFALSVHSALAERLWATPLGEGFFHAVQQSLHRLLGWLIALGLIGLGGLLVLLSASVIAAPFNDALSEAVEELRSGRTALGWRPLRVLKDVVRSVGLELSKWLIYAAVMGPLLILNWLLPGPGSLLYIVVGAGITALFFAVDYLDFAAARHDLSVRERAAFARSHLAAVMGLGSCIWLLLFIPLVNLFFMPAAVAGATLLFLDLRAEDLDPDRPPSAPAEQKNSPHRPAP